MDEGGERRGSWTRCLSLKHDRGGGVGGGAEEGGEGGEGGGGGGRGEGGGGGERERGGGGGEIICIQRESW